MSKNILAELPKAMPIHLEVQVLAREGREQTHLHVGSEAPPLHEAPIFKTSSLVSQGRLVVADYSLLNCKAYRAEDNCEANCQYDAWNKAERAGRLSRAVNNFSLLGYDERTQSGKVLRNDRYGLGKLLADIQSLISLSRALLDFIYATTC